MPNTIRIKRRASGSPGAPASLASSELAYNEVDDILYYGKGNTGGVATTIEAIGGNGHLVNLTGTQTITGTKTFSQTISGSISGNAATATQLATARTISTTGDATWSVSFNGTANASGALTLATVNSNVGTFGSSTSVPAITVNAKGLVTGVTATSIAFPVSSVAGKTGAVTLNTGDVAEGANLYYTDTRVRANRLNQMAVPLNSVDMNSQRLINLAEPQNPTDAATKNYVDSVLQGLDIKESVVAATWENITLSGEQTIDDIAVFVDQRVLVKNQTTVSENGVYIVKAGAWTRAPDANTPASLTAAFVFVEQGTFNGDTGWVCTKNSNDFTYNNVVFAQFSGGGSVGAGAGLTSSGNVLSVGGTANRISVSADAVDIAATYVGQSSITTLGTITTGTWNGTTIALANGGTGATTAAGARTSLGATTLGSNLFTLANVAAISFPRINADNTVSTLDAATFRSAIGAGVGSVTSVGGTGTVSGLTLSGTVTGSGNLTLGGTLAVTPSNFSSQTANTFLAAPSGAAGVPTFRAIVAADIPTLNQNTTGTAANVTGIVAVANGGTGASTAAAARTNLGATTVGANLFTLTNPSAISFPRINADNTVSALDAATYRTAIGVGTIATQAANAVAITGGSITNLTTFDGISIDGGTF